MDIRTSHMHCPISAKFGVRSLYLMLLCVYEFSQIRRSEDLSFLMGVTEIHLPVTVKPCDILKVKNA